MKAVWIEIPVHDLERAATFYQSVFSPSTVEIRGDDSRRTLTLSDTSSGGVGVSLNQTANFEPSDQGTLVYFQVEESALEQVESAGGKVVQGKTPMDEGNGAGSYALVQDSEGNLLALYMYP